MNILGIEKSFVLYAATAAIISDAYARKLRSASILLCHDTRVLLGQAHIVWLVSLVSTGP